MRTARAKLALTLALANVACDGASNLRSLVEDGNLPEANHGPTESIRVTLVDFVKDGSENLDVVLLGGRKLTVRRYSVSFPTGYADPKVAEKTVETREISEKQDAAFRRRINVFRPKELSRDGPFILPKGCSYISDGSSKAVVAFEDEQGSAGFFIFQNGCENQNARKLQDELRSIISTFPTAKAANDFHW